MTEPTSYYDWERSFKNKSARKLHPSPEDEPIETLGLTRAQFKIFLQNWKAQNEQ